MANDPDALRTILLEVEEAVRRAFDEGYRKGMNDSRDRMMRAVAVGLENRVPPMGPMMTAANPVPAMQARRVPPRVGLDGVQRGEYGRVIATFRRALLAAPTTGLTRDDFFQYCERHGLELTVNQFRDTMKRLNGGEEVMRKHGAYFPGPRLKDELPAAFGADMFNGVVKPEAPEPGGAAD